MNEMVQSLRNLGAIRIVAVAGAAIAVVIILIFLSMRLSNPVMNVLYSDLSPDDSSKIAGQLEAQGVKYEIKNGGTQIMVPSDKVLQLRMSMAASGIPSKGSIVGYEIFDKTDSLGSSNFVYNVNLHRALEGELSRTIASFTNVDKARVHLVIPKRELFTKDKVEPTASVVIKTKGAGISKQNVGSIINFVASSVPGLKPNKITVVTDAGVLLNKGGGDQEDLGSMASTTQEFKVNYESRIKNTIQELLEKSIGIGKVEAQVSIDLDFDRVVTNSEKYDPDGQVARSIQTVEEKDLSNDKTASDVSVANNLPDAKQNSSQGSNSSSQKTDETTNFEISKTITNHIKESGTIKKISVAVLVDGTYNDSGDGSKYSPRSEEEIQKLASLVKSAIGFDEKRGDKVEIVNMQFQRQINEGIVETSYDWLKRDFDSILKTLVIGIVAVLVILLVIKPLVNRAFEISPTEENLEATPAALASTQATSSNSGQDDIGGIDIDKIQNKMVSSSIKKISTVVSTNPEETLAVVRTWLNQK